MALNAGDAACSAGVAKTLYDYWSGDADNGWSGSMTADQTKAVKSLCYAIARTIVYEMQANATVSVTANTDAFGTGIPPAPVVINGSVG